MRRIIDFPHYDRKIPIELAPGVPPDQATWKKIMNFKPFMDYCKNMDPQFTIHEIVIQSIDFFGEKIGFLKLKMIFLIPKIALIVKTGVIVTE